MHQRVRSLRWQSFCLILPLTVCIGGCKTRTGQASSAKSINGQTVAANDPIAASTVGLIWDKSNNHTAGCSGTLIDSRHVLTAAHCFDPSLSGPTVNPRITFGVSRNAPNATVPVASYVANPDYESSPNRRGTFKNADLVVITLAATAPQGFVPTTLLTPTDSLKAGDAIIPAGFGVTQWDKTSTAGILHSVHQHIDSDPDSSIPQISYSIQNSTSDASQPDSGIDCYGDSGGPIYVQRNGMLYLAAVISSGNGYRCANGTAFSTDVRPLQGWVQKAVAGALAANQGVVFPDHFTDIDGTVYPYCSRGTRSDGSDNYKLGVEPALNGPGGKCAVVSM